jgi:hypothetical protein
MQMNKLMRAIKIGLSGALLALTCASAVPARAVAAEQQSQEAMSQEDGASLQSTEIAGSCCSYGYYTCSTNANIQWDYDVVGCGPFTKPKAQARCAAECGHACVDSGWLNGCP